jgi:hypothetical protein
MTTRFRRLFDERASGSGTTSPERTHFERARSRAEARQIFSAFALAYTLAAIFPLALDMLRGVPFRGVSLILAAVFGTIAVGSAIGWLTARIRSV